LEIFTFLYYATEKSDDFIVGSTKKQQHSILGKIIIWESRKNKISPNFRLFLHKVEAKQEVEKIIALKIRKLCEFYKRWEFLLSV